MNNTSHEGGAPAPQHRQPEINVLRAALDEMPHVDITSTPEVFRDIRVSDADLPRILERYQPGTTVEEPAFTSASKDIPPWRLSQHSTDKPNKVRFVIEDPHSARDLENTNPVEREVLFKNGNRFLVEDLDEVGDETRVYMRDMGQGNKHDA